MASIPILRPLASLRLSAESKKVSKVVLVLRHAEGLPSCLILDCTPGRGFSLEVDRRTACGGWLTV